MKRHFKTLAILAAKVCDDKKAENIKVIDLQGKSSIADFVVIATTESSPHFDAIEEQMIETLRHKGVCKLHFDGVKSKSWRVYDYGGFFVHLMTEEERQFYGIDKIYHFGKPISWRAKKFRKPKVYKTRKGKPGK